MDIPMNVEVSCTDHVYGRSTRIIINPEDKKVTHVVVRENTKPHIERIVPIELVVETTSHEIRLDCPVEETRNMNSFIAVEYIPEQAPDYRHMGLKLWPYGQSIPFYQHRERYFKVQHEHIPPGELALQKGARVKAIDGYIGHVQEFLVDPTNGYITHLVLREGHLWRQEDVAIDMSDVERIEEKIVYLKLAKSDINKLPPIRVR